MLHHVMPVQALCIDDVMMSILCLERTDSLISHLTTLSHHSSSIPTWSTHGDLLLQFFTLSQQIQALLSTLQEPISQHTMTQLENVRHHACSLLIKMGNIRGQQPIMEQYVEFMFVHCYVAES